MVQRRALLAAMAMALAQSILYLRGLHPGVADGDSAELQWAAPLLGIAHSPGYALQITVGKVFTMLPLGGDAAWRMNLLSLMCGVGAALALFSAVHRITGRIVPALVSQAMLAFGSAFWSQSLVAEVYVFGALFLCLAIDSATRFVATGRAVWLAAMSLFLGVAVAERPSEILVVPAFVVALFMSRTQAPITGRRWLLGALCLAAPFVVALALNISRAHPDRLAARDDALRDRLVGHQAGEVTIDYDASIPKTISFMLGLDWSPRLSLATVGRNAVKYTSLLVGGLGKIDDRVSGAGKDPMLAGGWSPGLVGLGLALLGVALWRKRPGWIVLGGGMFAGNLIFILAYDAWDSLTFTIPGQIGLALLAGMGSAGAPQSEATTNLTLGSPIFRRVAGCVGLALAIALATYNFSYVNRNTHAERSNQRLMERVAAAPIPEGSAILTKYWPAMTLRYLFWIRAGRTDVSVIHSIRSTNLELAAHLHNEGRTVFFTKDIVPQRIERELAARTPEELRSLGLLWLGDLPEIPLPPSR